MTTLGDTCALRITVVHVQYTHPTSDRLLDIFSGHQLNITFFIVVHLDRKSSYSPTSTQQCMLTEHVYAKTSLVPRPRPAFRHLQYRKAGEGLVHFLMWVTSRTGQIMWTWATCKPQKISPVCTHWSTTIPLKKMAAHEAAFMSLFTRQSGGQRALPSQDNNLVVLAHVQLKPFYRLTSLT